MDKKKKRRKKITKEDIVAGALVAFILICAVVGFIWNAW